MNALRVGCIVLGIVLIAIGLTADRLGIGFGYPGIGMFQAAMIVVGVAALGGSFFVGRKKKP